MKISSGNSVINNLLNGGYDKDIINTIYGPAGSGKTLLCLLALIQVAKQNKKVIFIDTEGGFAVERLKQLTPDYENILDNILFLRPTTFAEQKKAFEKLKDKINKRVGLVIVDTVSMLYRLELGKSDDVYEVNKELGQQLGYLNEIARKRNIPVLITNQVYADFENKDNVKIVGGDLLRYGSKCMLELKNAKENIRIAKLNKHRSIKPQKVKFQIVKKGIKAVS